MKDFSGQIGLMDSIELVHGDDDLVGVTLPPWV